MATSSSRTHRVAGCRMCAYTEAQEWRVRDISSAACSRIAVVVLRFRIPNPESRIPSVPQLKPHRCGQEPFVDEEARSGMNRCGQPVDLCQQQAPATFFARG